MHRLALTSLGVTLLAALSGCALPNLDDLLGGKAAECAHSADCADDEICDTGSCRPIRHSGEGEGEGEGGIGEGEGEGEGTVDPPPDPQGPQFLQFGSNVSTMGPSDTVIFTVVVTDPDGIDDIIGGSLLNPGNDAPYGAFTTSAAEGSYELALSWDALNTVAAIDFATTVQRSFRARFFDVAGHASERTIALTLSCGGEPACDGSCGLGRCGDGSCTFANSTPDANGNGLCNNVCTNLFSNAHCGSCDNSCSTSCGAFGDSAQCTCSSGAQCAFGEACFQSSCVGNVSVSFDAAHPTNAFVSASSNGFSGNVCFDSFSADLFCRSEGFTSGTLGSGGFSDFGIIPSCSSGSDFLRDCSFAQGSCTAQPITCSGGSSPGGDLSCAQGGDIPSGGFLESVTTNGTNHKIGSCGGNGPDQGFTFTAPVSASFNFIAFGPVNNTVGYVLDGDCNGGELACFSDATGAGNAQSTLFLSAGQRVIFVVDTFNTGGDVFGEVLQN